MGVQRMRRQSLGAQNAVKLYCIFDDDKSRDGFQADIHEIAI